MFKSTTEEVPREALSRMPTERLEAAIVHRAGQVAAAMGRWLELIAEFDRRKAYVEWGFPHCAGWLAWQCSLSSRSAREHVRVARCLGALPAIASALNKGEISFSKVRALTRIAAPETEEQLLGLAREVTADQLDTIVRDNERISTEAAFDAYRARSVRHRWDENGCLRVEARLTPEQGATFVRALEAAERFDSEDGEGRAVDVFARRADALALMAEALLDSDAVPPRQGENREVVVHVDADLLAEDGEGRCGLDPGRRIAAETARRISCDAGLVAMLDGPEGPLSVGRRSRTVPASIKRALQSRDGGCRFPGCTHRRFIDAHHVKHWARGGETALSNLVTLCTHHHTLVHEGGFDVRSNEAGRFTFHRPGGREVKLRRLSAPIGPAASPVTPGGIVPLSRGAPLDREHAAWVVGLRANSPPY